MKLELFRTLWGYRDSLATAARELRAAGFDGVEARIPEDPQARRDFAAFLQAEQLPYIAIVFTAYDVLPDQNATPGQHLEDLARKLEIAATLQPRFVNALAGNDRWPLAQQVEFFGRAQQLAHDSGLLCCFETHRGRSLCMPWITLEVARQVPQLNFTSDISHWVVCCERLLDHPLDDFSDFIQRVHHIQARVGYDQGPQVPHPGAPEYAAALAFHQRHWAQIWQAQQQRGYATTTLTPEFGPDGYLHHLPFTNQPVADLWQLNAWMGATERAHFEQVISGAA